MKLRHFISSLALWFTLFAWAIAVDNIWDASTDNDANTAANWSLNRVPIAGDIAVYDSATTDANCLYSGAISCDGMRFDTAYAGTVNAATFAITLGTDGLDCTGGAGATLDLGSGTWTCSGDWDYGDIGTLDDGASTVLLTGTADLIWKNAVYLYNLTIDTGAVITGSAASGGGIFIANNLTVNGTISIPTTKTVWVYNAATLDVGASGVISGDGTLLIYWSNSGKGIATMLGAITTARLDFYYLKSGSAAIPAVTYGSAAVRFYQNGAVACIATFAAGATTFSGSVELLSNGTADITLLMTNAPDITVIGNLTFNLNSSGDVIIDCSTKDCDWVVQGDVVNELSSTGVVTYTKGTGSWTFSGGNNQALACDMLGTMEVVTVDKSGNTLTLSTALTAESFTGTAGTMDSNGQTTTTTGNCTWSSGFDFQDAAAAMDGCSFIVGGDFSADSQVLQATSSWDLTVTGSATARHVSVEYSDASGGTEIETGWTCYDGGDTVNWDWDNRTLSRPWRYYRIYNIADTSVDANLTNFPQIIKVTSDSWLGRHALATGYDVRFTTDTNIGKEVVLPYERISYSVAADKTTAIFWVQVPSLLATGGARLRMWFGNEDAVDGEHASKVWTDVDYVGVWHLGDDDSDTSVLDSTGFGHTGTKAGNAEPSQVAGVNNFAQRFDGTDDWVTFPDMTNHWGNEKASLSMLISLDTDPPGAVGQTGIMDFDGGVATSHYPYTTGTIYLETLRDNRITLGAGIIADMTQWHHLTVTNESGAGNWIVYQNGGIADTDVGENALELNASPLLGSDATNTRLLDGRVEEFRLSSSVKSAAWIKYEAMSQLTAGNYVTSPGVKDTRPVGPFSTAP